MKKINPFVVFALIAFALVSCAPTVVPVISLNPSTAITKLDFSNQSTTVYSVDGLDNQSMFLVKMNVSGSYIPYEQTGRVYSYSLGGRAVSVGESESDILERSMIADSDLATIALTDGPYRIDSLPAQLYNANPPSPSEVMRLDGMARSVSAVSASSMAVAETHNVGEEKDFTVQLTSIPYTSNTVKATLRTSGKYCHIWVVADSYSNSEDVDSDAKLTQTEIEDLAANFDKIYPAETGLIGYEYGGDPALTASYGGKDRDPKISILVFDINGDALTLPSFIVYGYFTGVDYLEANTTYTLDGITYISNGMEMFYIDSLVADNKPQLIYSTLIHEFQHMINFNQKCIDPSLSGENSLNISVPTWYNEMLSLMAEEVIGTLIGLDNEGLPWALRMGTHINTYPGAGLEIWNYNNASPCYAQSYAFGTYLTHNFGGARILREMELNSLTGTASVENAVHTVSDNMLSFADIYRGYPETLLFSSGHEDLGHSYYRTGAWPFNGITYDCLPLDIGEVVNLSNKSTQNFYSSVDTIYPKKGISFTKLNYSWDLPRYGVSIHSDLRLQNVTGSASITVTAPENPNVEMYIVVR